MAAVAASHFVSHINGGAASVDVKTNLVQIGPRNQIVTHNGLRSVNKIDFGGKVVSKRSTCAVNKTDKEKPSETIICGAGMSVALVSTEVSPWCKTGGLGDVLGGLPPALAALGHRVMTICPRYDQYKDAWDTDVNVEIKVGDSVETVRFFHCYKRGVIVFLLIILGSWRRFGEKLSQSFMAQMLE